MKYDHNFLFQFEISLLTKITIEPPVITPNIKHKPIFHLLFLPALTSFLEQASNYIQFYIFLVF